MYIHTHTSLLLFLISLSFIYIVLWWAVMGSHQRGVQSEGGAVDGGSII